MCGILGSFNFPISMGDLLDKQHHRGPDVKGEANLMVGERMLQLGHNRLKIVCLDELANQPFIDDTKQHYLIFNGEIYNYLEIKQQLMELGVTFKTQSDTEVLLLAVRQWGIDAISHFNGMFALAYFNRLNNTLFLVRDRFGVKPLFYHFDNNRFMFASTSAIIATSFSLKPNFAYLKRGLQYGIYEDHSSLTAYENLYAVPAGHIVKFDLNGVSGSPQVIRYYDFKAKVNNLEASFQDLSDKELLERVQELLYDATWLRLQADVPVAVALSGGVDSGTIAAISKSQTHSIEAFCFGHPKHSDSEGPLAQQLAQQHDMITHFVEATPHEWSVALMDTLHHQDAPYASLSIAAQYLLYQKINQHGFKVVLGGQGGDEGFLGYRKFQMFYLRELIQQQNWVGATQLLLGIGQMFWAEKHRLKQFWQLKGRYLRPKGQEVGLNLPGYDENLQIGWEGSLRDRQIADVLQYSLPTLLRYEDRNSMAHSIESRLPFMDYRLLELACALPARLKLAQGFGKWPLRQLMQHQLPSSICWARAKRNFDVANNHEVMAALDKTLQEKLLNIPPILQSFIHGNILDYFSSSQFKKIPQRFTELTTILWLAGKYH